MSATLLLARGVGAAGRAPIDRRLAPREKTYKVARISFGGNRAVIGCLIHNRCETGACLAVEMPAAIPNSFNLVFESGEPSRTCHVMWRTGRRIGVAFS